MSVDKYLGRRYDIREYNCAHFVCDVWRDVVGVGIDNVLGGFLCPPSERTAKHSALRSIRFLRRPADPCIVLLQHKLIAPHLGVWIRNRVLHIKSDSGVQYQPLDVVAIGYSRIRFFTC